MATAMAVHIDRLILDKLNDWENLENPSAPLTKAQCDSIALFSDYVEKNLSLSSKKKHVADANEFDNSVLGSQFEPKENHHQFCSWLSDIEDQMTDNGNTLISAYIRELEDYLCHCECLLNETNAALEQLRNLETNYQYVSTKTNALHEACEHLLSEQGKLANAVESISEKLSYFTELDTLSQRLASPSLSVLHESFVPILARLDECLAYMKKHPDFKAASVYSLRFQHLLSQALGLIRSYVKNTLQQTTHRVIQIHTSSSDSSSSSSAQPSAPVDAFSLFYGQFRTQAPRIRALMEQIETRAHSHATYQDLLEEVQATYVSQRQLLLWPSVSSSIKDLASRHPKDHCALLRSGCLFFLHLCIDEHQLHSQFFTKHSPALDQFLEGLCQSLYDVFRPVLIHIVHLETLAELCTILKVEMLQERIQNNSAQLRAFEQIVRQMLEDVQERLVYRTHIYIQTDILGYQPAPGDLAYPEKLRMMESIAESLAQQQQQHLAQHSTLSRSSSRSSIASNSSSQQPATLSVSCSETVSEPVMCTTTTNVPTSRSSSQVDGPVQRIIHYSPADLHGMWYPTVRRSLVCLSKLYRCLDRAIFQGLSQEVLGTCLKSLDSAAQAISKNKGSLDGQLFHIKHLLILREQIAPFQIEFAIKETSLDFSRFKAAAYGLLQKKSKLFSLNSTNSLLEFLLQGSPQVSEQLIDSKKAVDNQLKSTCEDFISSTADLLLGPQLPAFLDKVKVFVEMQKSGESGLVLRNQPFGSSEVVATLIRESYRHLKTALTTVHQRLDLYLANRDTQYILFRPIKTRVQGSYEQLMQTVRTNYTEEDQLLIACPSLQQIAIILSSPASNVKSSVPSGDPASSVSAVSEQ